MDTQKIILIAAFMMTSIMLWQAWDKHNHPEKYQQLVEQQTGQATTETDSNNKPKAEDAPSLPVNTASNSAIPPQQLSKQEEEQKLKLSKGTIVNIETDVFKIEINIVDFGGLLMGWFPDRGEVNGARGTLIKQETYIPSQEAIWMFDPLSNPISIHTFHTENDTLKMNAIDGFSHDYKVSASSK